jgi:hypothetical protein
MKCKECAHYGFYQMITNGPYGFYGYIPCANCIHFITTTDNFSPKVTQTHEHIGWKHEMPEGK